MSDVVLLPHRNHIRPEDWLSTIFEEVTDPEHVERWRRLINTEPAFAREILAKALHEARSDNPDDTKRYVDAMTWVADVFLHSAQNS